MKTKLFPPGVIARKPELNAGLFGLLAALFLLAQLGCSPEQRALSKVEQTIEMTGRYRRGEYSIDEGREAIDTLVEIGEPAVEPLIAVLNDPKSDLQFEVAVKALAQIGDARAIEPLFMAQSRSSYDDEIVEALIILAPSDPRIEEIAIRRVIYGDPGEAIQAFVREIENQPVDVWVNSFVAAKEGGRNRIVEAVGEMDCATTVEIMSRLLELGDPEAQEVAFFTVIDMLYSIESECICSGLANELVKTFTTKDRKRLDDAIQLLNYMKEDPSVVEVLIDNADGLAHLLNNPLADQEAVMDLVVAAGIDPFEALLEALGNEDADIRAMAVANLGRLGNPDAIPSLGSLVTDNEVKVRIQVAEALGELGDDAGVPFLERLLVDEASVLQHSVKVQTIAVEALEKIGTESAVTSLMDACGEVLSGVRESSCRALSGMDRSLVMPLLRAIQEADLKVIADAYPFYLLWGDDGSEPVLIRALKQYGTQGMATAFLNCGNLLLEEAAKEWAEANDFTVLTLPGSGSGSSAWGSGR